MLVIILYQCYINLIKIYKLLILIIIFEKNNFIWIILPDYRQNCDKVDHFVSARCLGKSHIFSDFKVQQKISFLVYSSYKFILTISMNKINMRSQ
jgi:hypothetical protein